MSRTFHISCDVTVYKSVIYEVTADSFDEAREAFDNGYYDVYDDYENDECIDSIDSIQCWDCGGEEDDCDCEQQAHSEASEQFFAGIGL